jgi:ATP-binding cassette, subfamily C, bacterial CydD
VAFLSSMVLELLASLSVALVAVAIGLRLVYGDLTLQVGLTVLILAPEAYLPLRQLGTQFHAAADGVAATAKVLAILDTPIPAAGTRTDLPAVPGLRLDRVIVGEPGERGTIGPLSLAIPAGSFTVVTGDSGAGKTTLLQVLAGVQRPDHGHVLVGGPARQSEPESEPESDPEIDLSDVDSASWRARLAWAGQGAVIQAGTIRDNLALGNPGADDARLRSALEAVDAAEFVDELPGGWHTELGEGGAGISQGQRQRLALARALARQAALILLDEPTAALDEATEQRVLTGIAGAVRGRTVVLVTHRQAPVALADRVISMSSTDGARADEFGLDEQESLSAVAPW